MKKLLLVLLPFYAHAQFTGDYYGLYFGTESSLHSFAGLASVNSTDGTVTFMKAFPNSMTYGFGGDHAVDPIHNHYFQIVGDSIDMYLLNYNIDSGTLTNILFTVDSVGNGATGTTSIGGNIQGTFYNCSDGMLYFCHYKAPWENYMHFAKVNPVTAEVTEIDSFLLGVLPIDNLVVPNHQIAYFLETNSSTYLFDHLVVYDLVNNTKDSVFLSTPVPPSWDYWNLTYNPKDGFLYGIQSDLDSFVINGLLNDLTFMKIDPVDGTVTYISEDLLGNVSGFNLSLNFYADQFSSNVLTQSPGYQQLVTYDIPSGTYVVNSLTYSGFGNILYPSLIGLDAYIIPKECSISTAVDESSTGCDDPISSVIGNENSAINLGCYWNDYLGMHLQIYDLMGRKISDQIIRSQIEPINLQHDASQLYFYSITDGSVVKASGKMVVAR